jgi:hypothetical protein
MGRASGFGWHGTWRDVGGTIPAPAFLPWGKREKGNQIPCCRPGYFYDRCLCSNRRFHFELFAILWLHPLLPRFYSHSE